MDGDLDYRIALLVDGPNMFKSSFEDIYNKVKGYGRVELRETYLDKHASPGLIESALNNGFRPVIEAPEDVDTALAARIMEVACSPRYSHINLIAIASRDSDYVPVVNRVKEYEKKTLMIGFTTNGNSTSLRNTVDFFEAVDERYSGY
mgnify:FL=1